MIQCDRIPDACSREAQAQADFRHLQSKVRRSISLPPEPLHRLVGVHAILTRFRNKAATKVFYHVVFLARVW